MWTAILVIFLTGCAVANAIWMTYSDQRIDKTTHLYDSYINKLEVSHREEMGNVRKDISWKIDTVIELLEGYRLPEIEAAKQKLIDVKSTANE